MMCFNVKFVYSEKAEKYPNLKICTCVLFYIFWPSLSICTLTEKGRKGSAMWG